MPATTKRPATLDDVMPPKPVAIDLDAHKKELARLKADFEKRFPLEERLKMCNPKHARAAEEKKPIWRWNVEFRIVEKKKEAAPKDRYADDDGDDDDDAFKLRTISKTVDAQDEREAFARVCDKMGEWPGPRIAQPKFTKIKRVN